MAESSQCESSKVPPLLLDKNDYRFKEILRQDPHFAWKYCTKLQDKWKDYLSDVELLACMERWKESKSLHLVWVSDKFGGTLSGNVSEKSTYVLLTKLYKELPGKYDEDTLKKINSGESHSVPDESVTSNNGATGDKAVPSNASTGSRDGDRNAQKDRTSERQLKQHLEALVLLSRSAESGYNLSENLIKHAHLLLMHGLYTSDNLEIHAGVYRTCSVSADYHVFPHYDTVPPSMTRLVTKYNHHQKQPDHDPFELASWLLLEFLTIHPFEDGNGRVSRLLWCYSLMLDGLPFPLTPFPGIKKAYKQFVSCIKRDRDTLYMTPTTSGFYCKYTTSLTVVSVTSTWKNFISNLRQESPKKHQEVVEWLKSSGTALYEL